MRLPRAAYRVSSFFSVSLLLATILFFSGQSRLAQAATAELECAPCALHFGTVTIGKGESLPIVLTNSAASSVLISAISATPPGFSVSGAKLPLTLAAGQSVTIDVAFNPVATGWVGGPLTISSNAANKILVAQTGGVGVTAQTLSINPATLAFGGVAVGKTATLPVSMENTGTSAIVLTQSQLTGAGFAVSGLTLPLTLAAKKTATFNVTFTPQAASQATGSLVLPNVPSTLTFTGSGTADGTLSLLPASLSFGNVDVGSTATQPVTIGASGSSVTISSATSSSSQFTLQGASFPLTVASGSSVALAMTFTPKSTGTTSGTVTLVSNASNSQAVEAATGNGITAVYSVNLSWDASSSQVSGYNVYRSVNSKTSYAKINSSLDPSTSFTDSTVTSGQTYYYAATAVSPKGQESGYSTPIEVSVP